MAEIPRITNVTEIETLIFLIRGQRVMLSTHLAHLYKVEARVLAQAVKRNIDRFPEDFMFELSDDEFENLKSQIVISSWGGIRRGRPMAFTEQGIAMLSSVLRSKRAVQANIAIMRVFVRLREMIATHKELGRRLSELEQHLKDHDQQIQTIFEAIRQLMIPEPKEKKRIGFEVKAPKARYAKRGGKR